MPNKTLYISDRAVPVWDAASRVAKRKQMSLGGLLTDLLEERLPQLAEEPTPDDVWSRIASDTPTHEVKDNAA